MANDMRAGPRKARLRIAPDRSLSARGDPTNVTSRRAESARRHRPNSSWASSPTASWSRRGGAGASATRGGGEPRFRRALLSLRRRTRSLGRRGDRGVGRGAGAALGGGARGHHRRAQRLRGGVRRFRSQVAPLVSLRFDVVRNPDKETRARAPYLAVLQSHHWRALDTTIVAPLVSRSRHHARTGCGHLTKRRRGESRRSKPSAPGPAPGCPHQVRA